MQKELTKFAYPRWFGRCDVYKRDKTAKGYHRKTYG